MALYYEAKPAPDNKRGVVFADGHAARIPEAEWLRVKKASRIP
jgi:prepilin-type processing-associated H-X9-DG protein